MIYVQELRFRGLNNNRDFTIAIYFLELDLAVVLKDSFLQSTFTLKDSFLQSTFTLKDSFLQFWLKK